MSEWQGIKDIEPIIGFIEKGLNNPDKAKAFGYDAIEILTEIEYAPTVDVAEIRRGRWIYRDSDLDWQEYECSVCHTLRIFDVDEELHNYCPNCGAKMDKGEEENAEIIYSK